MVQVVGEPGGGVVDELADADADADVDAGVGADADAGGAVAVAAVAIADVIDDVIGFGVTSSPRSTGPAPVGVAGLVERVGFGPTARVELVAVWLGYGVTAEQAGQPAAELEPVVELVGQVGS
jgi:hypothetical protein